MRSKRLLRYVVLVVLAAAVIYCIMQFIGSKPFYSLQSDNLVYAEVYAVPPDTTVQITNRSTLRELTEALRNVVIYRRDDSYRGYCGQMVRFTIRTNTNETVEVGAYNPFIIIDGKGYTTKYEPCEALNELGNRIIDRKDQTQEIKTE